MTFKRPTLAWDGHSCTRRDLCRRPDRRSVADTLPAAAAAPAGPNKGDTAWMLHPAYWF